MATTSADAVLIKALTDYRYALDGFASQEWDEVFGIAIKNYAAVSAR